MSESNASSESSSPPLSSLRVPGSLCGMRRRNAKAMLIGVTSTDDEISDKLVSLCFQLLFVNIPSNYLPHHVVFSFRNIVRQLLSEVLTKKRELCSSEDQNLWCIEKVKRVISPAVEDFTDLVRTQLIQEKDNLNLYPQSAADDEFNTVRRFVEISSKAERGTRQFMEDKIQTMSCMPAFHALSTPESQDQLTDERLLHPQLNSTATANWVYGTMAFAAVFDGHMGKEASVYCRDHLHHNLMKAPTYPNDMETALKVSFETTHNNFMKRANETGCDAGTTATVCVIVGKRMYVANVGDSAAVLCKSTDESLVVTEHHHIDNQNELQEVINRGGEIVDVSGVKRIDGRISVTRTIGFKSCKHLSASPHVFTHQITEEDEFLVLASDGLWDVMTPSDVHKYVRSARTEVDEMVAGTTAPEKCDLKAEDNFCADEGLQIVTGINRVQSYFSDFTGDNASETSGTEDDDISYMNYSVITEALASDAVSNLQSSDNISAVILFFNHPENIVPEEP